GLSLSNFGTNKAAQGISSLSWIDFTAQGKTLNDGSVLFKMCFNVIGASGSSSIVDITDNPIQIEITDLNSNGENIGSVVNSGTVSVNTASSALYFDSTLVVLPGYTCNKLTVRNIQSIEKLSGTVAWDPALLSFDSICCMHPDLNYSSVNTFQSANGVILLNIDQGNAININSENVLFGVCFTGIGKPAEIAKIELDGSWFPYEIKAIPAGPVKVTKGLVSFQLKDLHFKGLEIKAKKGDIIEYPVVNSYPFSLLNLQGSLQFNTSQLNYTGFRKAKLDSMTEDSLNLSQLTDGQIGYSWTSKSPPLSCLVNDTLFFIKYQIVGDEDTTQLYGNNTVFNQSATIQNTSVFNLPIIVDTSFIIILPSGPKFQEEEGFGVTGDTVCTKLLVTDMKNVTGFKLELDYDSNLLKAIAVNSINVPNDPVWNITINNGKITIDWKDYTFSNGLTLNNGDALLEFCFELIGSSGTVGSIDLNTSTSFISRSDYPNDSFNISMEPGKINILSSSVLNFQSFIKNNPCEGDAQGDIKINIEGGKSPFQFLWSDGASSQNRLNLKDGFYSLTINDSSNPTQLISSSFEIKHYADNPKVYPIQDTQIKCPGDSIIVNSNAAKFQLNWYGPNAGIQALANGKAIINLPGIYSVKLYDVSTSCYSLDTFEIFTAPVLEPADAGPDQHSCEEILLNAIQSSDISGYWISTANVQLKDPGQKITEVLDLESGPSQFIWTISTADCPAYDSDSVWVFVPFPPIALDDNLNIQLSKKLNILENDLTKNGPFSLVLSDSFPKEIE
ncbi:MAG TPA: hypothetical protein VK590_12980, partial [Saprospiraceae bacterium]|nr:hypothetical protein [Saprospiraceae bacterium]